jgi:hypothetical protein
MMTEWQPIETAPRGGEPILLWSDDQGVCIGCHSGDVWWDNLYEPWRFEPTHWMPLPEPPIKG